MFLSLSDRGMLQKGVVSLLMTQPLSHLVVYISSPRKTLLHQSDQSDIYFSVTLRRKVLLVETWSQQVLTSETCGLTLFRIISRHSAASRCWWTAERVMKWFCSEILTAVKSCSLNHSPFLMASHFVMLRVSHLYIFILSKVYLSSLSTLLVVCCSLLSRSNFAEFYK